MGRQGGGGPRRGTLQQKGPKYCCKRDCGASSGPVSFTGILNEAREKGARSSFTLLIMQQEVSALVMEASLRVDVCCDL